MTAQRALIRRLSIYGANQVGTEFDADTATPQTETPGSLASWRLKEVETGMSNQQCPQCASAHVAAVRTMPFATEWQCRRCEFVFVDAAISVVLVDPVEPRREGLASRLVREGVPVVAVSRLAEMESWPVGKVFVTDVSTLPRFQTGATHVIVLADSDEDRREASLFADGNTTIVPGDASSILTALRRIAAGQSVLPSPMGLGDRRNGTPDRRRHPRSDRRS